MPTPRTPAPPGRRRGLPAFALYGEAAAPGPELLHVESISTRSRLYNWEIDAHVHQGLHQVLWLRAGSVQAMLDETRSALDGPAIMAIPPGVAHAFRFSRGCEGHVLTLNAPLLSEGEPLLAKALQALFAQPRAFTLDAGSPEAERLHALFNALLAETQADDAAGPALGQASPAAAPGPVPRWLARALVWRLAQCLPAGPAALPGRAPAAGHSLLYTRWVALVEAHYREHWPVTRYAQRLGLSAERLNRLVRAETGHTAQALLHARLGREAARRLVHIAAPVSKLAFELGFEDPAYFCRFFKRHTGLSPRAYRERAAAGLA